MISPGSTSEYFPDTSTLQKGPRVILLWLEKACRRGHHYVRKWYGNGHTRRWATGIISCAGQCHLARIREGQMQALWLLHTILWPNSCCPSQSVGTRPGREGPQPQPLKDPALPSSSGSSLPPHWCLGGIPSDPTAPRNRRASQLSSQKCGCLLLHHWSQLTFRMFVYLPPKWDQCSSGMRTLSFSFRWIPQALCLSGLL